MVFLFPASYVMLYMLSKRDTFACFECLSSSPDATQRLGAILPVHLVLSSNVRVGKYPLMANDATLWTFLAGLFQHSPALTGTCLVECGQGFGSSKSEFRTHPVVGAKRTELPCEASASLLWVGPMTGRRSVPQERGSASKRRAGSIHSSGLPSSSARSCICQCACPATRLRSCLSRR